MKQIKPFSDERSAAFCAFCGDLPDTRDHVPPKAFLDEPYPDNLPVVGSCQACNGQASLNEQYIACLLEVVACGSADPARLSRQKIARTLTRDPRLAARLAARMYPGIGFSLSSDDRDRLHAVLKKIACGIWAYEIGEVNHCNIRSVNYAALDVLDTAKLERFLSLEHPEILPEVGSRMLSRILAAGDLSRSNSWIEVQAERFSYGVEIYSCGGRVKMIVRDYLAAELLLGDNDLQLHAQPIPGCAFLRIPVAPRCPGQHESFDVHSMSLME